MGNAKVDHAVQIETEREDDLDDSFHSKQLHQNETRAARASVVLAERETVLVNRSKWLVYIVILLSAAVAGTVTYIFTRDEEVRWYEDDFEEFADEIFESTRANIEKFDFAMFSLAEMVTSHAQFIGNESASFPYVTLPNFAITAGNFASLGTAKAVAMAPLVSTSERREWESYAWNNQGWIQQDIRTAEVKKGHHHRRLEGSFHDNTHHGHGQQQQQQVDPGSIHDTMYGIDKPGQHSERHFPIWQIYPTPAEAFNSPVMLDLLGLEWMPPLLRELEETKHHVFSSVVDSDLLLNYRNHKDLKESKDSDEARRAHASPKSVILEPIFDSFDSSIAQLAGITLAILEWKNIFSGVLEGDSSGIILDLQYSCPTTGTTSPRYAFRTRNDGDIMFVGEDLLHDSKYDYMTQIAPVTGHVSPDDSSEEGGDHLDHNHRRALVDESESGEESIVDSRTDKEEHSVFGCVYYVSAHATNEFVDQYDSHNAILYTVVVCAIFVFTGLVFLLYDVLVQTRNEKVLQTAERSAAIVTSLFPKSVAEKMLEESNPAPVRRRSTTVQALKAVSASTTESSAFVYGSNPPIADLFKEATIMFGDIGGFTAWSSMREPAQVFKLLETIFNAFDVLAERRNVFKVETVGDCYVAVVGVPDPRKDHAVVMARFAWSCLLEVERLTKQLDLELGPDTSDLTMRFGLHSGAVTAGVLRGQRARFQLFGDAVNKASRIETSGIPGKIHLSQETADHLIQSGKEHWVKKRTEMVSLKGLGELSTYWLHVRSEPSTASVSLVTTEADSVTEETLPEEYYSSEIVRKSSSNRMGYLIPWHTEVLSQFLCKVVAFRDQRRSPPPANNDMTRLEQEAELISAESQAVFGKGSPSSAISFPVMKKGVDESKVALDETVLKQLGRFVEEIATAYNPNPFHNFQHASHVVMSVTKLLSHMEATSKTSLADPMTQFTAVFTALIHDVDHPGVSNGQLVKEGHDLAKLYKTSFAERNSLDVAWSILRQSKYHELRRTIYQTVEEFESFRELLVHSVLVTDLMDKDLQSERKKRWDDVFETKYEGKENSHDLNNINKKKLALLETLIQTSDVAHTMQHWSVYQHWNKLLHTELQEAYEGNRAAKHPSEFWYNGEIGFFDAYIVPLAQRLKDCPAFDASGQELLQYASSNRTEWEMKGKSILEGWN